MKKIYFLFVATFYACIASAQFAWVAKNTFPGGVFYAGSGFSVNGMGYVIGGSTGDNNSTSTNNVYMYNPASDHWTQKSDFSSEIAAPGYFVLNGTAYIVGGNVPGTGFSSKGYQYDATNDTWTSIAPFPENIGIGGGIQFAINNTGYMGLGTGNGASSPRATFYAYDPVADSWTQMANYPGPLTQNAVSFSIDSFGYAGLGSPGSATVYGDFYKYDPTGNTWSPTTPFPGLPRQLASSFVINGIAYVGGGYTYTSGGCAVDLSDFYAFDPVANTWTAVSGTLGLPLTQPAFFSIGNSGYLIGGTSVIMDSLTNGVQEFGTCQDIVSSLPSSPGDGLLTINTYPNPASDNVTVKLSGNTGLHIAYKIFSISGQKLLSGMADQNEFTINTSQLSDAVYLLQLTDEVGMMSVQRFEVIR